MSPIKKFSLLFLKYALGLLILSYVVRKTDFSDFDLNLLLHPLNLLLLIGLRLLVLVLVSLRWKSILKEMFVDLPFWQVFKSNLFGLSMTYLLPGSISADLGKGVLLGKAQNGEYKRIIASVFLDRIIGLIALVFIFFAGAGLVAWLEPHKMETLLSYMNRYVLLGIGIGVILFLPLTIFWSHRLKKISLLKNAFQTSHPRFWLQILGLSFLSHITYLLFMIVLGAQMNLPSITPLSTLIVIPLASLSLVIPLTPGSIGVGQLVYSFFYNLYSADSGNDGTILFSANQVIEIIFVLAGITLFFLQQNQNKKDRKQP